MCVWRGGGARGLNFRSCHVSSKFMYASSKSSGESVHFRRLASNFHAQQYTILKNHMRGSRSGTRGPHTHI